MLKTYLKIAFRNLSRNKVFSFINIFGLAIGLATCLLITLYILDELSYDRQIKDGDRIYRIASAASIQTGGIKEKPWAAGPGPLAQGMLSDLPEVEQTTRLLNFPAFDKMLLKTQRGKEVKQFYETNGYYVDSTFFQLFTYTFKYGDPRTALDRPNSLVISEEIAAKLFGNTNPVGQPVTIGIPYGDFSYTVKGVIRTQGVKSHIPAHFFLSMRNGDIGTWVVQQTNWATNNIFHTYMKLKAGADLAVFEKKLPAFLQRRAGEDQKSLGVMRKLLVQPVRDIYLHSDLQDEIATNGNITSLYILGSIAAFVLLIACINFMNLSTAHAGKRAREVGVRKVMGAGKGSLVIQFLSESVAITCLALLLGLLLTSALLPLFNSLTQKSLTLSNQPHIWLWVAIVTLVTGVLSGFYPALYLSSFRPIVVLKGKLVNSLSAATVRKGLVVFQFTISICLVLGAIVISRQLNFLQDQQLGFNKDQQIVLPLQTAEASKNYNALKNEIAKRQGVISVTSGSTYPGIPNSEDLLYYAEGKTIHDEIDIHLAAVNDDYFKTLGISLLEGRGYSREFTADSGSIVLNETALRQFGYDPKTAIGRKIYCDFKGDHITKQIIGVVKDFNFESLYNSIKPFGFTTNGDNKYQYLIASLATKDYAGLLKDFGIAWSRINPNSPFVYSFLDKDFEKNYENDRRTSAMVGYFTGFAILIACLGLFGLSAFTAEQRTKEIGIRKVLGASVLDVVALLSGDFIRLVGIAIVIATPLAWIGMNKWLQNFAYKVGVQWWMFVLAGLLAVCIALFTVSFQAIRSAMTNPAESLRSE
jgi:putative ABC transport system permease protein